MWWPMLRRDYPIQIEWNSKKGLVRAKRQEDREWGYYDCPKAEFAITFGYGALPDKKSGKK